MFLLFGWATYCPGSEDDFYGAYDTLEEVEAAVMAQPEILELCDDWRIYDVAAKKWLERRAVRRG